jgi:hypothetical protein
MRAVRSSTSSPGTSAEVAIAPALIIGFAGRPVIGSRLIALNGSPLGSAPTRPSTASRPCSSRARASTNGFEIDWMVNSARSSPTDRTRPRGPTTANASRSGSAVASSGM